MGWIGEMGQKKDPAAYGLRAARPCAAMKLALKAARNYGGPDVQASRRPIAHQHFGLFVVSCDKADLRPLPTGVMIYADSEQRLEALPAPSVPRVEVIDELYGAVVEGREPLHGGESAMATLQVCLAILASSRQGKEIVL